MISVLGRVSQKHFAFTLSEVQSHIILKIIVYRQYVAVSMSQDNIADSLCVLSWDQANKAVCPISKIH